MKRLALILALALSACTTLPQVIVRNDNMFDVRFDPGVHTQEEVDAKARAQCLGQAAIYVSQGTRFDGLGYRTYMCPPRSN